MAERLPILRCLIISPGDVQGERQAVRDAVGNWNAHTGPVLKCRVEAVGWETHARPALGGRPQEVINEQIVDTADFAVAVFSARLGTSTGVAVSGSVEEIDRLRARGVLVLVYFSTADIPRERFDADQYKALMDLKARLLAEGLLGTFTDPGDLQRQVILHLMGTVSQILQRIEGVETRATSPKPDVRVIVAEGTLMGPAVGKALFVKVENHSPSDFFFQSLFFMQHEANRMAASFQDHFGNSVAGRRVIRPGDSFQAGYQAERLFRELDPETVRCVRVVDAIGRSFESGEAEWKKVVGGLTTARPPEPTKKERLHSLFDRVSKENGSSYAPVRLTSTIRFPGVSREELTRRLNATLALPNVQVPFSAIPDPSTKITGPLQGQVVHLAAVENDAVLLEIPPKGLRIRVPFAHIATEWWAQHALAGMTLDVTIVVPEDPNVPLSLEST